MAVYNNKQGSGKCFVFLFGVFVMLCALVLVFACVLRARNPRVKLRSGTFTYSASPSFNATLIISISISLTIRNPNYGPFTYDKSSLTVLYDAVKIGHGKIRADTLSYRQTKLIHVTVNARSAKVPLTPNLHSGSLNLTSYVKFSGTLQLLKIINIRKTVQMGCAMTLVFTSHAIQAIQCQ